MGRMTEGEIAEARRLKIRKIMLRRPACKALRWDGIRNDLSEIYEEISEAQWMDGPEYDKLCQAVDWDDEVLFEFRIAFSDLAGQCQQMYSDMDALRDMEKELFYEDADSEYDDPPALFDLFFPAINTPGEVWGYDITEHDYYGFQSAYDEDAAREQARKRLMRLTKEQLIKLSGLCMEIARQYLSLISRHDALSSVLAILKQEEEVRMQTVVRLETLYEEAARDTHDFRYDWGAKSAAFDLALSELPDRIWVE